MLSGNKVFFLQRKYRCRRFCHLVHFQKGLFLDSLVNPCGFNWWCMLAVNGKLNRILFLAPMQIYIGRALCHPWILGCKSDVLFFIPHRAGGAISHNIWLWWIKKGWRVKNSSSFTSNPSYLVTFQKNGAVVLCISS